MEIWISRHRREPDNQSQKRVLVFWEPAEPLFQIFWGRGPREQTDIALVRYILSQRRIYITLGIRVRIWNFKQRDNEKTYDNFLQIWGRRGTERPFRGSPLFQGVAASFSKTEQWQEIEQKSFYMHMRPLRREAERTDMSYCNCVFKRIVGSSQVF